MRKKACDDTIVAVSTPVGEGGIGIVRLSGPSSVSIAAKIFKSPRSRTRPAFKTHTVYYGHVLDGAKIVDEVILTVMRAPKTYTREDIVEINCHGGIQAVKKVLELAQKHGARLAEPGEFTRKAFLSGRIDLAQAEAVLDVIRAKTEGSLKVAMAQLEGGLSASVDAIREELVVLAAHIEASIDFPDEELDIAEKKALLAKAGRATRALEKLIASYGEGAVLREGVLAIICGKPNAGKSSLMNLLLKRDRVIVSPIPGTTRDAVEEMINLKGIPIRLVDTAGIVETKDLLEREGVARSKKYLGIADIAILVLDASTGMDAADEAVAALVKDKKKIVVINKCDLTMRIDAKKAAAVFPGDPVVEISVGKRRNIDALEDSIVRTVWGGGYSQGEGAVLSNARHKELLDKALDNMLSVEKALKKDEAPELVAVDLKEAVHNLGLVIGKSVADDVLDRIFEQFCIGK